MKLSWVLFHTNSNIFGVKNYDIGQQILHTEWKKKHDFCENVSIFVFHTTVLSSFRSSEPHDEMQIFQKVPCAMRNRLIS